MPFSAALLLAAISFDLPDAHGRRHTSAELRSSRAAVFLFLSSDCPLSNRCLPDLTQLHHDFTPRDVLFFGVGDADLAVPFPVLLDPSCSLARQIGATVTPEAAVISPKGEVLYRGRIDDRVLDFGATRPRPARADLRLALEEILAGRPVSVPATRAVGCDLPLPPPKPRTGVKFTQHVAPILYRHCIECHRPGESGPFPLLTYADAARRARLIAAVTARRYMPPWKPKAGYGKFRGERRLTPAEITTLRRWAEGGAPEGDPKRLPAQPRFPEGWRLGEPALVVEMPEPFPVPAGGEDVYQCFVIPAGLDRDRFVRAIEFRPANPRTVHHALLFADPAGIARAKDASEPGPGYRCFGSPGFLPARGLGGWTPGSRPITLPEKAPLVLRRGSDLVLQLHFAPSGKPETAGARVGLYFTDTPPELRLADIPLGSRNIDIPPGDRAYKVRDGFTIPIDVDVLGVIPHAHYICKDMKGWAVLPGGKKQWLIWIDDWDFNWQDQYHYQTPIRLPAGTRVEMEFTYDNSDANPRNPNHPPKRVTWGAGSTDEMAGLHIQVLPVRMADMPELGQALWGKLMRSVGGGFFTVERPEQR